MVFTLRNQFVGAVIVIINFGIGERFFVVHFTVMQHLLNGGLTEANRQFFTIHRGGQSLGVSTVHEH